MRFLHYRTKAVVQHRNLPGMETFSAFYDIYGKHKGGIAPVDRNGDIKFPVRMASRFPLPKICAFAKSYEDVCNERAVELLQRAERLDTLLYVFWSGGVDSTCVLISLLKNAKSTDRIVVLMSEDSITEYPLFYRDHIRTKLRRDSSILFPSLLGSKYILVSGEHNDQLFGSDVMANAIRDFGFDALVDAYSREFLTAFLKERQSEEVVPFYVSLFERLRDRAPIKLRTNYDLLWWANFNLKWQTIYARTLNYTNQKLSEEYLRDYYAPFFCTEDFQLWSMNNLEGRIDRDWRSYKLPAKKLILEYTKDADYYENKRKRGSLVFLFLQHNRANFIEDNLVLHHTLAPENFYEENNDFR